MQRVFVGRREWCRALVSAVALAGVIATAFAASSFGSTPVKRCADPAYASGGLIVRGVGCRTAARVLDRARAHPGCHPSAADQQVGRGCYGSTRVGRWRCSGLFPGEGFDLRCRSGARRIHGSAGG